MLLFVLLAFVCGTSARAEEVIPPKPTRYFNDYAQAVSPGVADRLNSELETLEEQSSNQILVCIYPKMQTDSSIEDFCHRIYAGWGVGQKGKNNGAVLFVFKDDHKDHIETGRGLEGPLPDSVCEDILEDTMAPKFQAGDFDGAMTAGVEAMIQATKGEFKGNGRTANQDQNGGGGAGGGLSAAGVLLLVAGVVIFLVLGFFFPGLFNILGLILNLFLMGGGRGGTTFGGGGSSSGGGLVVGRRGLRGRGRGQRQLVNGITVKAKHFLETLDHARVTAAIAAAERATSGQIRVTVHHHPVADALVAARRQFTRLEMEKTAARNGVLVFLAPESRKFAVVGDQGIHARCGGDEYWQMIVGETMRPLLKESRFTDAIVAAVAEVGRVLAEHFPPGPDGGGANELPDDVLED